MDVRIRESWVEAHVDEKGRVRLSTAFQTAMAAQEDWSVKVTDHEKALQIERAANGGQRVEFDADGRMHLPPAQIENFAGKAVHLRWRAEQMFMVVDDVHDQPVRV